MKVLNKFLWMCFTLVVNVFCYSNSVLGSIALRLEQTCNGGAGKGTCVSLAESSCNNGNDCYNDGDIQTFLDTINEVDLSEKSEKIEEKCSKDENKYMTGCYKNGVMTSDVSSCVKLLVDDTISSIVCAECPDGGTVATDSVLEYTDVGVWVCGRSTLVVESDDEGERISEKKNSVTTPSCREYSIRKYNFEYKTLKDCYRPAKPKDKDKDGYDDEKGIFTYTEDCYIDTE